MEHEDKKDFAGKNGFTWWIGIVEDRQDPLKLGRCRVRCVGWHAEDKMHLPTNMLPWATPSYPVNNTNTYTPKEGDMVFGFFMDGENAQNPIILGVFPSIPLKAANRQEAFNDPRTDEQLTNSPRTPASKTYNKNGLGITITEKQKAESFPRELDEPTTSRIARNESEYITKTYIQERKDNVVTNVPTFNGSWSEPVTQYAAKYPYNNVTETESGHIVEFDDTPGKERIHFAHRNGTFQEMFPNGDKVEKVTRDNYTIIMKDDHVYIMGKCNITVQGDAEVYVQKNASVKVDGNVNVRVGGNYNEQVGGTYTVQSGGNMSFTAPRIDWN
jgi:predicted ThiF/HesA family dinucleotide-utilizing enzyme